MGLKESLIKMGAIEDPDRKDSDGYIKPIVYGENVIFFDCREETFGVNLQHWITTNQDKQVISISPSDTGGYGYTIGYFVVLK